LQKIAFLCRWLWRITAVASILFTGCVLLFFFFLIVGIASLQQRLHTESVQVPNGCALVLAPPGRILEKQPEMDPVTELAGLLSDETPPRPLLLEDIVSGLRAAAKDSRIKMLLIAPNGLSRPGWTSFVTLAGRLSSSKPAANR
jgi:protease-4